MRILIAGGGTGGHLFPGLALAGALRCLEPRAEIAFVGSRAGLDTQLVPAHGYRLYPLPLGRGSPLNWRQPLNAPRFLASLLACRRLFARFAPDIVVSLGGFAAAPAGMLARWCNVPLLLLEQNTIPGRVTQLLARWAREIHLQFPQARAHLQTRAEIVDSGSPLRAEVLALLEREPASGDALLILGGSQGALKLNRLAVDAVKLLGEARTMPVIHIAGAAHRDGVKRLYEERGVRDVEIWGFCDSMPAIWARTRLAISRAGALSLAEMAAAGVPGLMVPFPAARDDHQTENAKAVAATGAGVLLEQSSLSGTRLADNIRELWNDALRFDVMAHAMRSWALPDAGCAIARRVLARAKEGRR